MAQKMELEMKAGFMHGCYKMIMKNIGAERITNIMLMPFCGRPYHILQGT